MMIMAMQKMTGMIIWMNRGLTILSICTINILEG